MRRLSKGEKETDHDFPVTYSLDAVKDRLSEDKPVIFRLKYEGSFIVTESRGLEPVRRAFKELRKTKEERRKLGIRHTPIKEFVITLNSVSIRDPLTKDEELSYTIRSISYIVNDEKNRNYIGMIAQMKGKTDFECTILKNDEGKGREIVNALGVAFDLAYDKNINDNNNQKKNRTNTSDSNSSPEKEANSSTKKESISLVDEISILKSRLRDLAVLLPQDHLKWYLKKEHISDITEISHKSNEEKEAPVPQVNLIGINDEVSKIEPSVGTKLENLIWQDATEPEVPLARRRSSTGTKVVNLGETASLLKKQEEVLLRRKVSEGGTPIPREDPFDMGDFNAVSFPEFDEFYVNLNETEKAELDLLA